MIRAFLKFHPAGHPMVILASSSDASTAAHERLHDVASYPCRYLAAENFYPRDHIPLVDDTEHGSSQGITRVSVNKSQSVAVVWELHKSGGMTLMRVPSRNIARYHAVGDHSNAETYMYLALIQGNDDLPDPVDQYNFDLDHQSSSSDQAQATHHSIALGVTPNISRAAPVIIEPIEEYHG